MFAAYAADSGCSAPVSECIHTHANTHTIYIYIYTHVISFNADICMSYGKRTKISSAEEVHSRTMPKWTNSAEIQQDVAHI